MPAQPRKVAFLGATKGMGRALARELAARGDRLFLLGRDAEDLEKSARDLEARCPPGGAGASVGTVLCDLENPETFAPALDAAAAAFADAGGLDTVVVTAGVYAPQGELEQDLERVRRLLTIDFTHTILFCEEARRRLLQRHPSITGAPTTGAVNRPTLCVFSSVAGERGRKPVLIYGAGKAGLSRYLEGLDHKFHGQGLRVVCVKPGFVRTGMTAGLKQPPFTGEPEDVAKRVVRAIDRGAPVVYAPAPWRWVMLGIRSLPRFLMRRLAF